MKLFIAFVALVAVTAAVPFKPAGNVEEELEAIIAAIQHPSTDPATAALLEQQLQEIISAVLPPVIAQPILVDEAEQPSPSPIVVPTPIVPSPIVPSPIVPSPIVPSPIVPSPIAPSSSPLVQIVVNVKNAADIGVGPAIVPSPIQIVDEAIDNNPIAPTPIQIVDAPVAPAEPILIADPIVPLPAINLPLPVNP